MTAVTAARPLLHLALLRDRLMIPIWLYALVASVASTAWSYRSLYSTVAERRNFAASAESNGATRALYGHVYGADSVGGLTAWRMVSLGGALLVVFTVLLLIRHSRAEEEAGRTELLSAGVVGRAAPLMAAVLAAVSAAGAVCAVAAAALMMLGLPVAGALAFGAAWLGIGVVFAGVASVAAQLTQSARAARGIALAVAAVFFAVRVIADGSVTWLTWCTPFGWAQQVRPYAGDRWWALALPAATATLLLTAGFAVHARRDLGAGLLPQRPGPPRAGRTLRSALSLNLRLGRGSLTGWFVGLGVYGLVIGGIASSAAQFTNGNASTEDLVAKLGGRGALVDSFLGASLGVCGLAAAAYGITAMLRARDEEVSTRLEALLATRVGRWRWFGGQVALALAGATAVMLGTGVTTGIVHGLRTHQLGHQFGRVLVAVAGQLPAVWLVIALAAALVGCLPRAAQAGWALLGICAVVSFLGPVVNAAQPILDVSPFSHLPATPGAAVPTAAVVCTTGLALVAAGVALVGFRRRDIG